MDKEGMKALIERTRAHQAEFIARNPDFRAEQEARVAEAVKATPATTAAASKQLSKKKKVPLDAMRNDLYHRVRLGKNFD